MSSRQLYIGLMSGTSIDGIDVALLDMQSGNVQLIDCFTHPYPTELRHELHRLCQPSENEVFRVGQADIEVALAFAQAVKVMLSKHGLDAKHIQAIGSHGQTIRHSPNSDTPFTVQICDANTLAVQTNIDVVADFRRKDLALGGQGAPLVPAFHQALFSSAKHRAIINIGGIANITWLPATSKQPVLGFDTGPGNALMDAWCSVHTPHQYDENSQWAMQGKVSEDLLTALLSHPYLSQAFPKSTGRELFHLDWLQEVLAGNANWQTLSPEDVQHTLLAFTAKSILLHLEKLSDLEEVYLCGGGANNPQLVQAIQTECPAIPVQSTLALGMHPDAVEAAAFAWFAYAHKHRIAGNIPSVTGASKSAVLGGYYPAN